eukprot:IDg1636t1
MATTSLKEKLASLAKNWIVVVVAYIAAFLPLTVIYALDFISPKWKSIRVTRRDGIVYLLSSIPPLVVVIFYIILQGLAKEYTEMAAATTAAVFCLVHIMRTIWGLIQLHVFKEWSTEALRCLMRMGYEAPFYDYDGSSFETAEDESGPNVTKSAIISKIGSPWHALRRTFRQKESNGTKRFLTEDECRATIDYHMKVNNTIIDNEFYGADLPFRFNFKSAVLGLWRMLTSCRKFSIYNLMETNSPGECEVYWLVSFLSRFGYEWVRHTKKLEEDEDALCRTSLKGTTRRVSYLADLHTTFEFSCDDSDGNSSY